MSANKGKRRIPTLTTISLFIVIVLKSSSLIPVVALDHQNEQSSNVTIETSPASSLQTRNALAVECAPSYSPNTVKYMAGEVVSNNGKNYICRDPPRDNWCNNEDYEPGVGSTGYWGMAWRLVEECQGQPSPPPLPIIQSSSAVTSSSGKTATAQKPVKYSNGQITVSNIRPMKPPTQQKENSMADSLVQYAKRPPVAKTEVVQQADIQEIITEEVQQQQEATIETETSMEIIQQSENSLTKCAKPYTTKTYQAGDIASFNGKNYECRSDPISAWCGIQSYAPGSMYWYIAWMEKEECTGPPLQGGEEDVEHQEDEEENTIATVDQIINYEGCGPLYQDDNPYLVNDIVSSPNKGQDFNNYKCISSVWCGIMTDFFQPGVGVYWNLAWELMGPCVVQYKTTTTTNDKGATGTAITDSFSGIRPKKPTTAQKPKKPTAQKPSGTTIYSEPEEEGSGGNDDPCPPSWSESVVYSQGDTIGVQDSGRFYECKPYPYTGWCSVAGYQPLVSGFWADAWEFKGFCEGGTDTPTPEPTPQPSSRPTKRPKTPRPTSKQLLNGDSTVDSLTDGTLTLPGVTSSNTSTGGTSSENSLSTVQTVFTILNSKEVVIDDTLFLYQGIEPSTVYRFQGFIDGLNVMVHDGVAGKHFYLGSNDGPNGHMYGLVNIAAFLGQSMKETIQYDACDENSWDLVDGTYPLSNACGQLGQSYQDYHCSEEEKHMECAVDLNMSIRGNTNAKWYGAPGPMFCGPKSEYPFTGKWDYGKECNRPWADPPSYCTDYEGQKAGGEDNSVQVANRNGRTDVEGCCWWGRGVIQTTGICNFGKLNYYLGKRAAVEGRDSRYPKIDFCTDPGIICSSDKHKELKWIAGMFYWIESLQSYDDGKWNYMEALHKFVDEGMTDSSFINGVSGVVNRGCPLADCGNGPVDGAHERAGNFKKVLSTLMA